MRTGHKKRARLVSYKEFIHDTRLVNNMNVTAALYIST